tara:strand:- start:5642 stop:6523 length:882 start_codon:yes stop_codon:yes gene_type:complete
VTLSILGNPAHNPSAGASASANLIVLRDKVASTLPDQRITALLPQSEIKRSCTGRPPFDVMSQFPRWIQKKHNAGESKLITLMEYYYKWLYCEFGSGYVLDDRMLSIHDVDETTDDFVDLIARTYAPDLKVIEDIASVSTTREFIKNIRKVFYSSKGTKQSIYHFFNTLFKDFVYVEILFPSDNYTSDSSIDIGGGTNTTNPFRTNSSLLTDSNHRLNQATNIPGNIIEFEAAGQASSEIFTYSVKAYFTDSETPLTDKQKTDIESLFRRLVHPVGTKLNFEINTTNLVRNID